MGDSYRKEPNQNIHVEEDDARYAKCGSPTRCTIALAGNRAINSDNVAFSVAYNPRTFEITCSWRTEDLSTVAGYRYHRGVLRPAHQAMALLMLTDTTKRTLVKSFPPDGFNLVIENHESRPGQPTRPVTEETRERRRARDAELKRLRAEGIEPPSRRRTASPTGRTRFRAA